MKSVIAILATITMVSATSVQADETELGEVMHQMADEFKAVGEQARKQEANEDSARRVRVLQTLVLKAYELTPVLAEDREGVAKTVFIAEYRSALGQLLTLLPQAEVGFVKNANRDAIRVLLQIKDLRAEAHEKFKPEDEDHDH